MRCPEELDLHDPSDDYYGVGGECQLQAGHSSPHLCYIHDRWTGLHRIQWETMEEGKIAGGTRQGPDSLTPGSPKKEDTTPQAAQPSPCKVAKRGT